MSLNKTTKKHFKIFIDESKKWINRFGLTDWDIDYYHEEGENELAFCCSDPENRCARIHLNSVWPDDIEIIDRTIKQSAFHEVCELMFSPLCHFAKDRYVSEVAIDTEKHAIIRTLENVLFGNIK